MAERLRSVHGLHVQVGPLEGALRRYDPARRTLVISEQLPRESLCFHLAFQLVLLEARDAIEAQLAAIAPTSPEAASLIRLGLLNYATAAVLMPYARFREAASALRHDVEAVAARFGVSFEQVCHRLSSLQRPGARGVPFFFLRVDPAGNVASASRPPGSRSRASAAPARVGSCTGRSRSRAAFTCRSRRCRTGRRSCASRAASSAARRIGANRRPRM